MKILIISKCPTHPTDAGNRACILAQSQILKQLGNEIFFLYIDERGLKGNHEANESALRETKQYWGNHFFYLRISKLEKAWYNVVKQLNVRFHHGYQSCDVNYPHALTALVNKLDAEYHFDICIVNYYYLTKLFEHISIPKKAILTHDCIAYKDLVVGEKTMTIDANTEAKAMQRSPYIFALQDMESNYFQLLSPLSKVYNIYSKYDYHPSPIKNNHNIVFLSGQNGYNVNGLKWFLKDVFPLIRQRFSDAVCVIAGGICRVIDKNEVGDGVKLLGYVESPATLYEQGDVAINPTYQGTGLKIKTFESISYDKVTMVHPHSMKGVYDANNTSLFYSEKPEEWVEFLVKLWETKEISIADVKKKNEDYMNRMNDFIISEYKRFLAD